MRKQHLIAILAVLPLGVGAYSVGISPGDDPVSVRDAIRAARATGKIGADEPVTVTFAPGVYSLREPLKFGKEDSGSFAGRVVWRAEKPGTVRFFGGRRIPRTAFTPISDEQIRKRLEASVRDKVRVCDATPYLVKEPGAWPDALRGALPGPWLYLDGEPQQIARWPNADDPDGGWAWFTNVVKTGGSVWWGTDANRKDPGTFVFEGDRAARWKLDEGVWMVGYWHVDWFDECLRAATYDPTTHHLTMATAHHYGLNGKGEGYGRRRFFALNLLEELDRPGEWYFDHRTRKLYWYPPESSGTDEIVLAQDVAPFIAADGLAHADFENLSFEYSHGADALVFTNCVDCRISRARIANHAGKGVAIHGRDVRVEDSLIRNVAATAASVSGGDRRWLLPANNTLRRCRIERFGLTAKTKAAIVLSGCGNALRDCTVTDGPFMGLSYAGNDHLVADCDFHHIVLEALDSGAIYSGHNASWLGTVLFGNHIHDLTRTALESSWRSGVYFDDCDWGDDLIGNVFERTGLAVLIGGGKLHGVYNNLMFECVTGISLDGRGHVWRTNQRGSFGWHADGHSFARYRTDGMDVKYAPWHVAYPELEEAMDNYPELPKMNVFSGNVFCACRKPYGFPFASARDLGMDLSSNVILTNAAERPAKAPQPIAIKDAVRSVLVSEDGSTRAIVGLDASGHLSWAVTVERSPVLGLSPIGVTVGTREFGRKSVPGAAVERRDAATTRSWTEGTVTDHFNSGHWRTKKVRAASEPCRTWMIPVRNLVTGETDAQVEVRVWKGGAALRWHVPGAGARRVFGENGCFRDLAKGYSIVEFERPKDYPESFRYPRGESIGISFPEVPRGWTQTGEVVTPWRAVTTAFPVK